MLHLGREAERQCVRGRALLLGQRRGLLPQLPRHVGRNERVDYGAATVQRVFVAGRQIFEEQRGNELGGVAEGVVGASFRKVDQPDLPAEIKGLPPGPIASAGRDALRAILEPADTPYIFFVSRNDGTHIIAETYREHAANVDEFQRKRRRRR